jgi:glycosyltransferase involved in cell wall biosynthesis
MRIAQVAPLAESVPPKLYGGTERVVSWLTEELVSLGCEVTLLASGDSSTSAALVPICPRALRLSRPPIDPAAACAALLDTLADMANDFDVIHSHLDWVHLPLLRRLEVPFVTTMHGRLDLPSLSALTRRFASTPMVSISDHQRIPLPDLNWVDTIYHGLPEKLLSASFRPEGGYLAFLGRVAPEKGPDVAIRIAKAAGLTLRIAAKIPRSESRFFKEKIRPLLDSNRVEFIGEVGEREKAEFLGNAAALLFPIDWPEPFGLVMIEAMACGTPVIAWRRGSVPEIIDHGRTGFIVESEEEAVEAIGRLRELDRRTVRAVFEQRFTARRMAEDYLRCFEMLSSRRGSPLCRQTIAPDHREDVSNQAADL